jgi:SpoVK/Ycf46/Vps4 family AAA+-type ATPase
MGATVMNTINNLLWQDSPREVIAFDDLCIPDEVDDAVLEVLCDGSISQHLLLHGPAGTGKTAACRAIAAARTNSKSLTELRQRVNILNCKNDDDRKSITSSLIMNTSCLARFADDNSLSVWIFDEIDFLTETQQNQLIAAIDEIKDVDYPITILATSNRDINDKRFIQALISRFHYKEYYPEQSISDFATLVQKHLRKADVNLDDDNLMSKMSEYFGDKIISVREARAFTNKLILQNHKKSKPKIAFESA